MQARGYTLTVDKFGAWLFVNGSVSVSESSISETIR